MELGLSLGESPTTTPFSFLGHNNINNKPKGREELGFCMALGRSSSSSSSSDHDHRRSVISRKRVHISSSSDPNSDNNNDVPLQLDLLPSVPVPRSHMTTASSPQLRFPWLTHHHTTTSGRAKVFDVNRQPGGAVAVAAAVTGEEVTEDGVTISSPNSTLSSFHMDFCNTNNNHIIMLRNTNISNNNNKNNNITTELEAERTSSRASDDDENGSTRKKLRLSKEQSAFLEESFKEHSTLNPKQKLALAKQLNLRPRQVEVWFQNRRARTKLKQTEVDCEYLKRCCETLTEENRRLQKELQELRALKTSQPFYMQLPATTLTMCPSCERVATANSAAGASGNSQPQAGKA